MAKKSKSDGPNIRDALTTAFIEQLQRDFAEHGKEIIEKVRNEAPAKYSELILRLIPMQPTMVENSDEPQDSREVAQRLLRDVGLHEASDSDCEDALTAYDQMIESLTLIRNRALGALQ